MNRRAFLGAMLASPTLAVLSRRAARADELPPDVQKAADKGLDWIAKTQHRDGHWGANGDQYPTSMSALAGMALLMEGSTLREGKYATQIRKAVDWYLEPGRVQRNGLIGNPSNASEAGRYMYGHGFSLLFLACVYGEEEDGERRKRLEDILTRTVIFTGKAQSSKGGWYYTSKMDGGDADEGSVTVTQVQALRAARNAGIPVPKEIIDGSRDYLQKSTTANGGVQYSIHGGGERLALTAAAIACGFSTGEYNSPIVKKWIEFCQRQVPLGGGRRFGHDEYTHYYYAQSIYTLGDDGYEKLFPNTKGKPNEQIRWSTYKKEQFDHIIKSQGSDGSWASGYIGPIFASSVYLTILQLDKAVLPIYQK